MQFLHCFRNFNMQLLQFQSLLPTLSWTHNLDDLMQYKMIISNNNYFKKISWYNYGYQIRELTKIKKEYLKKFLIFVI